MFLPNLLIIFFSKFLATKLRT